MQRYLSWSSAELAGLLTGIGLTKIRDLAIPTNDGVDLPATHFAADCDEARENGPTVIISSAVAAPRRIYRHFAAYLVQNGVGNVYTYDFRGLGNTHLPASKLRSVRMSDWAMTDFPAAVRFAKSQHPHSKLIGIGHSFGTQLLGLSDEYKHLNRYLGIAGGTGSLKHAKAPLSVRLQLGLLNIACSLFGATIPERFSPGTSIPVSAFREWTRWNKYPDYMLSDPEIATRARFSSIDIPLRLIGFSDDKFTTKTAFDQLNSWFSSAKKEVLWYDRTKLSKPVGHMGFFKNENRDLWEDQTRWILAS